jgi:hypothetical protein
MRREGSATLSTILPVRWPTSVMCNRDYENVVRKDPVDEVVWEATHSKLADLTPPLRTDVWILVQPGKRFLDLDDETVPKPGYPAAQKRRRLGEIILRFGKESDFRHSLRRR